MDVIPAWVRRLWDVWDLRVLVLLSLALQITLSLFGSRRKYTLSRWVNSLVWVAYLTADWTATVALGKLSDAQVDYEKGNTLRAIWAPMLLLHLGGPDTITAYSMEDNQLWMRHLFGLGVQFFVAVYVILMYWNHSWFSLMLIPALIAGFIKYGERTWALWLVSRDKSGKIVPFGNGGRGSNHDSNNTSENNSRNVLCIAHRCAKAFKEFAEFYDMEDNDFELENDIKLAHNDIKLLWNAVEVEMGLMFDLLYTKAPINFRKTGLILRCFTFLCTVAVLIGLIFQLSSIRGDQEKWQKIDNVITGVLLVGALALEIYAIISSYLFSDWAMLWLIKHNKNRQLVQFRQKKLWFFLPKQYRCRMMGQFNLVRPFYKNNEPNQNVCGRRLWSLWGKGYENYVHKSDFDVSLLFDQVLHCCRCLTSPSHPRRAVEEDPIWIQFFKVPWTTQIVLLYFATEICYDLETEWDAPVAFDPSGVSQVDSQPTLRDNKELCRTLSLYMMYLLLMHTSLLPVTVSGDYFKSIILEPIRIEHVLDIKTASREFLGGDMVKLDPVLEFMQSKRKDERWEILKLIWVRMLCYAASKGQRNEHFRQLSQGGEFLTFLWFFIPQSVLLIDEDDESGNRTGVRRER